MFDYERFSYASICVIVAAILLVGLGSHINVQFQVSDNIEFTTL